MATPTTSVHIANLALSRLGQKSAASLSTPTQPHEDKVVIHYDAVRRAALRKHVFNFAKEMVVLTEDEAETPAFGSFAAAYELPANFIRLLAIGDVTIDADVPAGLYEIVGEHIYTNEATDDGLPILYIKDETNVSLWDALFVDLMKFELAWALKGDFPMRASDVQVLKRELDEARSAAAAVAGQEKPPRRISRSKWSAVRRGGAYQPDPSRTPF